MNNLNLVDINRAIENKIVLEGFVERVTADNSMIIRLNGEIRGIIPFYELYEQVEAFPHHRVGTNIKFLVKEIINRQNDAPLIILSPREYAVKLKEDLLREFNSGNEIIVSGIVQNVTDKMAFVDIGGGLIGALHIKEVCKVRLNDIREKITKLSEIQSIIKGLDSKNRIQLSQIKLHGGFLQNIQELGLHDGMTTRGIVRGNDPNGNGVFVELAPNLVGLADFPRGFRVKYGQNVSVNVKKIEPHKEGVSLVILSIIGESSTGDNPFPKRTVPDLKGLSYDEALNLLKKEKFHLTIKSDEFNDTVEAGRVIGTLPAAHSNVSEITNIKIFVSRGKEKQIELPDLIGMNVSEAERVLKEIRVNYTTKREYNNEYDKDLVCDVDPPVGSMIMPSSTALNLLVSKGRQITAEVPRSPFAMRKNERKVLEKTKYRKDVATLLNMYHDGAIDDVDLELLNHISKHKFIISIQLTNILKRLDLTQDKIQRRLERLMTYGLLARYFFNSDEGKGIFRAYCMELNGNIFLNKVRGVLYNNQNRHIDEEPFVIKRHLAANQVLISYILNNCLGDLVNYEIDERLRYTVGSKKLVVKAHLSVGFQCNGNAIDCKFEVIRRPENWNSEILIEKLRRYQTYYETLDKEKGKEYKLIVVCEDEAQMINSYESIENAGVYFKGTDLLFTCDLRHNPIDLSNLPNSLVRFNYFNCGREYLLEV